MALRRRTWFALLVGALLVAGGAFAFLRLGAGAEKFDVVSIATTRAYQDPVLLERAWKLPAAAAFKSGFVYQANGSLCGPTTLVDVERSEGVTQATADSLLKGTGLCATGICMGGLTLDQVAELERKKSGRKVTVLRDLSLASFRDHLRRSNDPTRRYTVNFHRGLLFGQGHGHHSPIGGYLEDLDLVFVLDVNEKFKPWLAPSERVFRAFDTVDSSSGKKRGLLLIE